MVDNVSNRSKKLSQNPKGQYPVVLRDDLINLSLIQHTKEELLASTSQWREVYDILKDLHRGKVNHRLLGPKIIDQIIRDIKENSLEFNLPDHMTNSVQIREWCQADGVIIGDKLIITLHIPLVDKINFELFRMHSVPVVQQHQEYLITAEIKPKTTLLARSNNHRDYFFTNEDFLDQCKKIEHKYYCNPLSISYDANQNLPCELQILNGDKPQTDTCRIEIKHSTEKIWKYLDNGQKWLYSAP